nr:MAG TPA: repressor domain protein [Caudoviricetes sp.]DAY93115.1 MAG TPA: repressor domain protein [Caudoviricetes sp.]
MDLLTARSRCIFFVMSTNPIQVLKQTELLGHQFTVYGTAENPLFLTKEVADIIEYSASNSSKLTNLVDRDEKVRNIITTPGGNQEVWLLTEDGLYEVLFQSRKPIAKEFKKGVKEILKTIRKTGGYIATKQDDTPEEIMARALIVAQETIKRKEERLKQLEEKNAKLKPKADFAETAFKAEGKVDIGQAAKILNLGFGRNTLFKKLKEVGVFFKDRNEPKQKYIDAGYFEMTLLPPIHRDSHPDILYQKVLCKPKGLAYINYLFGGKPSDGKTAKIK